MQNQKLIYFLHYSKFIINHPQPTRKLSLMPRLKTASTLLQGLSSQPVQQRAIPSHITLFCSETQANHLLTSLPDVKPVNNLSILPKLKAKINKTHLKLQASARQAYKLALASNLIRGQEKYIVVNSQLYQHDNSPSMQAQALQIVQRLKQNYKPHAKASQKLTTAISAFPLHSIKCPPHLHNKWILDDSSLQSQQILAHPYTLLINPTIIYATQIQKSYEECISFPFMEFMIPRYNQLLIHYYNENHKSQFAYTHGFVSRMIQHQCEHLEGKTLIDWRINHGSMTMNQSVVQYFPKASAVLDDYANTLKTVLKEFPQLTTVKSQYFIDHAKIDKLLTDILKANSLIESKDQEVKNTDKKSHGRSPERSMNKKLKEGDYNNYNSDFTVNKTTIYDQLPFEDDFVVRLVKHFKKEFAKFDQKIQLDLISSDSIRQNKQSSIENKQAQLHQYNEIEYSKQIKVKYLNLQQSGIEEKLSPKQQKMARREKSESGDYELSDKEADEVLAKHKKGKRRK